MLIYCITNLVNNKKYIGQTKSSLTRRYRGLNFSKYPPNPHLRSAYEKWGSLNFKIEVILRCSNREALDYWERYYIELYDTTDRNKGYNKIFGGHLTKNYTSEAKKNMSEAQIRNIMRNPEKILSHLHKINTAYWNSYENKLKKSQQMREICSSTEQRLKMALVQGAKPFKVFKKDTMEYVGTWINKAECARDLNLNPKNVRACYRGSKKSHLGYIFVREEG